MLKRLFFTILFVAVATVNGIAQCSMCKAVAETGAASGANVGGINDGIMYLMGIPYILILTAGYLIYRKNKIDNSVKGE